MKVAVLKNKSKQMRVFDEVEWKHHDIAHFGREVTWDTKTYYLKVQNGSGILGTMELKVEAGVGHVKTLLVGHDKMRQGVGKVLMEKAEEITRTQNGHKLFLTTGKEWEALNFYEAIGFKVT